MPSRFLALNTIMGVNNIIKKINRSQLTKHAGQYTLFNLVDKLIPFIVLPIISRVLTVEAMGFYILYQTLYNFSRPLLTVNIDSGIMLNHYHKDAVNFRIYFSSGVFLFIVVFALICLLTPFVYVATQHLLNIEIYILYLIYIQTLFYFFNRINLNIWRKEKKPKNYGVFTILLTLTKNMLMLYFVFFHIEYSWKGIVFSQVLAQAFFFVYNIWFFLKRGLVSLNVSKKYIKEVFRLGSPLSVHQLGVWSGNMGSRAIINLMIGATATGLFGIAATFGIVIGLFTDSFNQAFAPDLYDRLKKNETSTNNQVFQSVSALVKTTYLYGIFLFLLCAAVSLIGYFSVGIIFGDGYLESRYLIPWIVFGYAFNGMYKMHINYLFYYKKPQKIATITIFTGLLNLGMCAFLISWQGNDVVGAGQAFLIAQLLCYLLAWLYSNKEYPMPWFGFNSKRKNLLN